MNNAMFDPAFRSGDEPLQCDDGQRPGPLPGLCLAPHAPLLLQLAAPMFDDDYALDFGSAVHSRPRGLPGEV